MTYGGIGLPSWIGNAGGTNALADKGVCLCQTAVMIDVVVGSLLVK
jgi:hypothetical protein